MTPDRADQRRIADAHRFRYDGTMEQNTKPKAGLSIVALVFASLFFVPLFPLVGVILGVVALATRRARTMALVAVCLGAVFTLLSVGVAAISISFFRQLAAGAKRAEANRELQAIARQLRELDEEQWQRLPDSAWTPPGEACARPDHKLPDDGSAWQVAPWTTLRFDIREPHFYQYRLRRDGDGVVIEARADIECKGRTSQVQTRVTR